MNFLQKTGRWIKNNKSKILGVTFLGLLALGTAYNVKKDVNVKVSALQTLSGTIHSIDYKQTQYDDLIDAYVNVDGNNDGDMDDSEDFTILFDDLLNTQTEILEDLIGKRIQVQGELNNDNIIVFGDEDGTNVFYVDLNNNGKFEDDELYWLHEDVSAIDKIPFNSEIVSKKEYDLEQKKLQESREKSKRFFETTGYVFLGWSIVGGLAYLLGSKDKND